MERFKTFLDPQNFFPASRSPAARAALAEYKKIISPPKRPVKAEIKGESAYQGKVIGRAKIVLLKKDLPNIPPHSILVAPQTTPEFTPQLKKVAAIVTDEGGILCHAAIISRELKKPCVIGTKIATQVLKDGDWVEVNANEGIVRVLK
jgi:pyruvate,water dikinase